MDKTVLFTNIKDGETFTVAGIEFIKFPNENGTTPVVMKDIAFRSKFGGNNDFRSSEILKKMEQDILPKIIEAVGEENVLTFKTDLTAQDGLNPYGELEARISLPTMDFYRKNVEIFDKYNPNTWWGLATPESAQPHEDPYWVLCVSPSGYIFINFYCNLDYGVRPFLIFNSSIFESFEEQR